MQLICECQLKSKSLRHISKIGMFNARWFYSIKNAETYRETSILAKRIGERAIAFCDVPFTDLSLRTPLALILLAMWNLLVLWTAWKPERNGDARGGV